ncbi:FAD-dependent oxidoreductase [Halovenus sp. WSH3]|uniref:FAD-dependent oxidoreductase n=1 Tax=Halovenus carboxidivorans TaxID=2692199 RepID=A0A6B0T2E0_9EURY|nr:FAD-dependent oxidoreductase [Halovenus carboxidivorans]MXR52408.1 FAD-dependent oxidoreductase [Halovenus carboxidivorans]
MVDRVSVIGGGAVGLQAASTLAERGVSVSLFEAGRLGSGASGRAAGICYDAYADRRDAGIAAESLRYFREHDLLTECPYLWFACDAETADAIDAQAARMADRGRDVERVDEEAIASRFPALRTDDIERGAIAHNAGYVDTDAYLSHLAARAKAAGVSVHTGAPATVTGSGAVAVDGELIDSDAVLVAAGAGTADALVDFGADLALGLYRTQALVAGEAGDVPIYYNASTERYARPTDDGVLAGDGSEMYHGDADGYDRSADDAFLADRLAALRQRLSGEQSVERSWAGLCTATPDRDPLVGELDGGVYVATGLCGHGLMRSPALGRAVADQMLGGDGITGFDPGRFDGDEPISLPLGVTD